MVANVQSHLARYVPQASTTDAEILRMKARAWRDREILVVSPGQLSNPIDQQMVRSLGERLYGERAHD